MDVCYPLTPERLIRTWMKFRPEIDYKPGMCANLLNIFFYFRADRQGMRYIQVCRAAIIRGHPSRGVASLYDTSILLPSCYKSP